MRPDDQRTTSPLSIPSRDGGLNVGARSASNEEVANLARGQIDAIFGGSPTDSAPLADTLQPEPSTSTPASEPQNTSTTSASPQPASGFEPGPGAVSMQNIQYANQQSDADNPYERSHNRDQAATQPQANNWQTYHSAWQNYYQQYYERYYVGQVHEAKKSLEAQSEIYKDNGAPAAIADQTISTDEALYDLRSQLRSKINQQAGKIRKSRHFWPAVAAGLVMVAFVLLQYNRFFVSYVQAYVVPGKMEPASLIAAPGGSGAVSPDPKLIIPTIAVDVPIVWDADAASKASLDAAMMKGVAWFNIRGASARPGQMGNMVLSGHSSNDWMDGGEHKFIFARLEQLKKDDTVYVNYNSTRYTYVITHTQVVKPTDVNALLIGTDKPYITLITCTPLGTDWERLLVFGEQVSPDPKAAAVAATDEHTTDASKMPSNSPTFLQRIFGINKD